MKRYRSGTDWVIDASFAVAIVCTVLAIILWKG